LLDLYNPNAIRASQGLIFSVPIVNVEQTYLSRWLSDHRIQCFATTPDTPQLYWDADYRMPTAFLFGSESNGLSDFWLDQAKQQIRIPMAGKADSLNVAATAAICLYEARRQRTVKLS
jgi:TrmH family RNA methyltransferase